MARTETVDSFANPFRCIISGVKLLNKRRFDPEKDTPIVLGREPLFQKFDVEFKGNKKITFRK